MKNVLVTGGAGFIGSNFVRMLIAKEPEAHAIVLDALTYAGNLDNLKGVDPKRWIFVDGDVADEKKAAFVFGTFKPDTVVHFAAESHVDRSIHDPGAFVRTNITGTWTLLEQARRHWGADGSTRFHHISTDEVYGSLGPEDPAFTERTSYDPSSPYSASKAAADHLVRAYHRTYGLSITISNCSNNFGPYQYPEKLIPLMILNAKEGKPLPVYGDGKQRRDWLYVEDHCEAVLLILKKGRIGETYNIGGDNEAENIEIVRQVCRLVDGAFPMESSMGRISRESALIRHVEDRPGHDRRYAINFGKLHRETGWLPAHSMADGLRKTVDWYLSNPEWVQAVRKKGGYAEWHRKNYAERAGAS